MTYERDWKRIDDLLISGCLGTEIAGFLGVHHETLYRWVEEDKKMSFAEYMRCKRAKGDGLLKAQQFSRAMGLTDKGDNTMLVWLGKCRLQQREYTNDTPNPNGDALSILHDKIVSDNTIQELKDRLSKYEPV